MLVQQTVAVDGTARCPWVLVQRTVAVDGTTRCLWVLVRMAGSVPARHLWYEPWGCMVVGGASQAVYSSGWGWMVVGLGCCIP